MQQDELTPARRVTTDPPEIVAAFEAMGCEVHIERPPVALPARTTRPRCDCSYVIESRVDGRKVTETFGSYADAREAKRAVARRGELAKAHAAGLHRDEPRAECPVCEAGRAERERVEPTLREYGALAWTLAQRTASP
jgi:hypothetical protein